MCTPAYREALIRDLAVAASSAPAVTPEPGQRQAADVGREEIPEWPLRFGTESRGSLELARPVNVGAVLNSYDVNPLLVVVDAVDDAVVASACAVQPGEAKLERFADPVRVGGQGSVEELHCGCGHLLGQPGE